MHTRAALLQPANHLQKIFKRQIRVQAAHDVKFQRPFARALFGAGVNFFQGEVIRSRRAGIPSKRAELAMGDTNVGRIDVPIDVEIGDVPVFLLAHAICQPTNRQQVRRAVQPDAVVNAQALACQHFLGNRVQPLVGDLKFAHFEFVESFKRAKPLPQRPRTPGTTY